jgi:hypothetical protein
LYFVQLSTEVFMDAILLSKKVVGVFVRFFRAPLHLNRASSGLRTCYR